MTYKNKRIKLILILGLLIISVNAACVPESPAGETPAPFETTAATQELEETLSTPSPTTLPEEPVVLLVPGGGADPWTVERVQTTLEELVTESGLGLVVQEDLAVEALQPNVRVVVGISLGIDSAALAGANLGTAFVFINQEGVPPGSNLSVIGDPNIDQQRQSFMAGYLAALISDDYKVAGLFPVDHALSEIITESFVVGVEFFCGVCNPLHPPFQNFPQWESLSVENAAEGFQPVVDGLLANGVEILYIQDHLASPEMLTYLTDKNVKIIGDQTPEAIRNNWAGTVARDPAPLLIELWPDLLENSDGVQVPSAITLKDNERGLISEGRTRLFEEMADDLEAGLVSPETIP